MAALPSLTETDVRATVGPRLFERAEADLAGGMLTERLAYRNGVLTAMWDSRGQTATPSLTFEGALLAFDCLCARFENKGMCVHCAGLALAWAREPRTFEHLDEDIDLDDFYLDPFDALEADTFFEDDGDPLFPATDLEQAAGGRPPVLLPPAEPAFERATTLTAQWPSFVDAYAQALQDLTVVQLRALAQRRGVTLSGTKREGLVETLANALGTVPALQQAWQGLSDPARLVAGLVPFVETDYGSSPVHVRQVLQSVNAKLLGQFDAAVEELQNAGLLFFNRTGQLSAAAPMLFFIPPDANLLGPLADTRGLRQVPAPSPFTFGQLSLRLLLALKAEGGRFRSRPLTLPHPLSAQAPELRGWPADPAELEQAAQAPALYQALNQRPLTVPPAPPLLADDDLQRLAHTLGVSPEQTDFMLRLLIRLGLLDWSPGEPLTVREEGFLQYLALTPIQHVAPLYNAHMSVTDWTELNLALASVPGLALKRQVRYGITYQSLLGSLETARFHLLQLLRRAPPGQWTDVDQLVNRARSLNVLHAFWPLPPGIFMELSKRSLAVDNAENWKLLYRPFVEALFTGPLHWQGLLDLGYQKDKLAAVRITDLGALVLYQSASYNPPPVDTTARALEFAPDGGLRVAPASAGPQLLNTLSLLGEARAGADGTLSYTVTPAGAVRAFQSGWEPEPLLETLAAAAGEAAPEALAGALRQWWAHFGDVHLYPDVALLELADDYALPELLSSTSLAQHLLFRFSPRVIALRPEGVAILRAELEAKGYTPKVVDAEA